MCLTFSAHSLFLRQIAGFKVLKAFVIMALGLLCCLRRQIMACLCGRGGKDGEESEMSLEISLLNLWILRNTLWGLKLSSPLSDGSHTAIKQDGRKLNLAAHPFLLSILYPIFILFLYSFYPVFLCRRKLSPHSSNPYKSVHVQKEKIKD